MDELGKLGWRHDSSRTRSEPDVLEGYFAELLGRFGHFERGGKGVQGGASFGVVHEDHERARVGEGEHLLLREVSGEKPEGTLSATTTA